MADSFSTYLQIRLPATGAYDNTWGATLNSDAFQLLDAAIAGWITINIGSSTAISLPAMSPGSASNSRYMALFVVGTPPSACTLTVPASVTGKLYVIFNDSTGEDLILTYGGVGTTVTVADGEMRLVYCDGENVIAVTADAASASSLGGIPAQYWVRRARTPDEISDAVIVKNAITVPSAYPYQAVTEAPTTTLDCNSGNTQRLTLTGNRVMAAPVNATDGQPIDFIVVQDSTGSRTLTWNSIFLFENGLDPVLGTAPGAIDRFLLLYNQSLNRWTVGHFANLNSGAGTTLPITIDSNSIDWNLKAIVGTLGAPATINILVTAGTVVESSSPGTPAMDLSGLISGCTINLTNLGMIQGRGGRGGRGAGANYPGTGATMMTGLAGFPGGNAIKGPGSGCTFNITNGAGFIWGGGGGGGGGGASISTGVNGGANGGGGGGGSGAAPGGEPGLVVDPLGGSQAGTAGGDSSGGYNGTFGSGGSDGNTGAGSAKPGGAGGDWGAAGTAGAADTTNTRQCPAGAAGAAGKAIELSGGSATFTTGAGSPHVKGAVS